MCEATNDVMCISSASRSIKAINKIDIVCGNNSPGDGCDSLLGDDNHKGELSRV